MCQCREPTRRRRELRIVWPRQVRAGGSAMRVNLAARMQLLRTCFQSYLRVHQRIKTAVLSRTNHYLLDVSQQ
jgi:hypothetical protein